MRARDWCGRVALVLACAWLGSNAHATLDCRRPKARLEHVICSTPSLKNDDAAVDRALAEARARNPGKAVETQASQRAWLVDRDAACATSDRKALIRCLDAQYRFRQQVLAASMAGAAAVSPPPPPAPSPPTQDGNGLAPAPYVAEAVTLTLGPDETFTLREIGGDRQANGHYAYSKGLLTFSDGEGDIGKTRFPLQCRILRTAAGFAVLLGQSNCHPFDGLSFRKAE